MTGQTTQYFWLITTSYPAHDGMQINTIDGTVDVPAGATRQAIYQYLRAGVAQDLGYSDFTIQHFQLEPNQL